MVRRLNSSRASALRASRRAAVPTSVPQPPSRRIASQSAPAPNRPCMEIRLDVRPPIGAALSPADVARGMAVVREQIRASLARPCFLLLA